MTSTHETEDREPMKDLSLEERRERYGDLARALIELAWRDARPNTRAIPAIAREAREFLFSEEAEFWAELAGLPLHRLRRLLDKCPPPDEVPPDEP